MLAVLRRSIGIWTSSRLGLVVFQLRCILSKLLDHLYVQGFRESHRIFVISHALGRATLTVFVPFVMVK